MKISKRLGHAGVGGGGGFLGCNCVKLIVAARKVICLHKLTNSYYTIINNNIKRNLFGTFSIIYACSIFPVSGVL